MEPHEVANVYSQQAKSLAKFIESLKTMPELEPEEYKQMLVIISQKYKELLENLAIFTPLLSAYKVKFYKLNELANTLNLSEPPFEKAFFNNHDL